MTKHEFGQKVKNMLAERPFGYVYTEDEQVLLDEFFSHHPNWEQKRGCGIKNYYVGKGQNTTCFWIKRVDGTETDIGINKVLGRPWKQEAPPVLLYDVKRACRHAVKPLIDGFRERVQLPFVCIVSGKMVTSKDDMEVDHVNDRFCDVFKGWWEGKSEAEQERIRQAVNPSTDGCTETYFTDASIAADFAAYHKTHTHLRAISKEANQKRGTSTATIHRHFGGI